MADYTLHGRQLNVGDKVWDCFNQKWLMVMRLDDTCGIYFCEPMSPEKIAVMYAKDSRTQRERNLAWDIPPAIKARLRQSQPKGTTGGYLLNDAADQIEALERQLAEASTDAARWKKLAEKFYLETRVLRFNESPNYPVEGALDMLFADTKTKEPKQ